MFYKVIVRDARNVVVYETGALESSDAFAAAETVRNEGLRAYVVPTLAVN